MKIVQLFWFFSSRNSFDLKNLRFLSHLNDNENDNNVDWWVNFASWGDDILFCWNWFFNQLLWYVKSVDDVIIIFKDIIFGGGVARGGEWVNFHHPHWLKIYPLSPYIFYTKFRLLRTLRNYRFFRSPLPHIAC